MISGKSVRPIVADKGVKFIDPRLKHAGEIQLKAVGCGIFSRFSNFDNCQLDVASDVIPGAVLNYAGVAGMDVRAKFCDSRLNSGRMIRLFARLDPFYAILRSI